jgi:predicted lactoylglutathione lyase
MNATGLFLNLPVKDIVVSRAFWESVGFRFQEEFSNERAACLILGEGKMYAMLVAQELFETFTYRPICPGHSAQVLLGVQLENRELVDNIVALAIQAGATRFKEAVDHGWMYYDSFADIDGHQWEWVSIAGKETN